MILATGRGIKILWFRAPGAGGRIRNLQLLVLLEHQMKIEVWSMKLLVLAETFS